jgi:uncharacterized RDD family membrane protein YckC
MTDRRTGALTIRTPEGVVFSLTLAGPVTRFLAVSVDLVVVSLLSEVVGALLGFLGVISRDLAMAATLFAYFVLSIGYGVLMEWRWRGRTLGKMLLKLKVMDVQGLKLTFSQVVIRNLMRFVDILPGLYLVGGMACLISRRHQRLGDLVANTIVVRQPKIQAPDLTQLLTGKYNSFHDFPHLEARLRQKVSPHEAGLALQALIRRDQMEPGARVELFREMADHFKKKADFPAELTAEISDEQYVRNVVATLYRAGGR